MVRMETVDGRIVCLGQEGTPNVNGVGCLVYRDVSVREARKLAYFLELLAAASVLHVDCKWVSCESNRYYVGSSSWLSLDMAAAFVAGKGGTLLITTSDGIVVVSDHADFAV